MQWAAVKMVLLLRIEPPQYGLLPKELTSPTCHGYSLISVTTPPTILVALLGIPQLQVEASDVLDTGSSVEREDAEVVGPVTGVMETGVSVLMVVVKGTVVDEGEVGTPHVAPSILFLTKSRFSVTLE